MPFPEKLIQIKLIFEQLFFSFDLTSFLSVYFSPHTLADRHYLCAEQPSTDGCKFPKVILCSLNFMTTTQMTNTLIVKISTQSSHVSFTCIAQQHKSQICLNLSTNASSSILYPQTPNFNKEKTYQEKKTNKQNLLPFYLKNGSNLRRSNTGGIPLQGHTTYRTILTRVLKHPITVCTVGH